MHLYMYVYTHMSDLSDSYIASYHTIILCGLFGGDAVCKDYQIKSTPFILQAQVSLQTVLKTINLQYHQ